MHLLLLLVPGYMADADLWTDFIPHLPPGTTTSHADITQDTSIEALIDRIRAMGARLGAETFIRQSAIDRPSDTDGLAEITCPTLVIASVGDQVRNLPKPANSPPASPVPPCKRWKAPATSYPWNDRRQLEPCSSPG